MALYMISYDLKSPTNNRTKVEDDIKSMGSWCKYVSTTFLVSTSNGIDTVQSIATSNLDSNDFMIICKVEKPVKGCLTEKQWQWIEDNL